MDAETLQLLQSADDPKRCEYPDSFDWEASMARVRALLPELERIIGQPLNLDRDVQDASFFTEIRLDRAVPKSHINDVVIGIRFSSFGDLFTVWSSCCAPQLPEDTVQAVIRAVTGHGFRYVDWGCLDEVYSGANPAFVGQPWNIRLFNYL